MGNCMEKVEIKEEEQQQQEKGGDQFVKGSGSESTSSMRIKIVLTKEELEWLMFQLKDKTGKRLEDVLGEMEKERDRERGKVVVGWKPSLESIMESPEVLDMNRS